MDRYGTTHFLGKIISKITHFLSKITNQPSLPCIFPKKNLYSDVKPIFKRWFTLDRANSISMLTC